MGMNTQVRDLENYNDFNILVTGGSGQVGSNLKLKRENNNFKFFFPSSKELNFLEFDSIDRYLNSNNFHLIINLAAYTNVDRAETEKEKSNIINNLAVKKIAKEANKRNIFFIQSSTDYVFGKNNSAPYSSLDKVNPINHYGHTKSLGEEQALNYNDRSIILRFASVFSLYGNNFIKKIMKKLITDNVVEVVSDQKISLTYAGDFSSNILSIINFCRYHDYNKDRIFHFVSEEFTDWFSVANVIYEEINSLNSNFLKSKLVPISATNWDSKVKRPDDSRLTIDRGFLSKNDIVIKPWEDSVRFVVKETFCDILDEIKNEY